MRRLPHSWVQVKAIARNQPTRSLDRGWPGFIHASRYRTRGLGVVKRLRVGLVGAGLVGQAEHAFYLWEERERFDFVALADASPSVREALRARYGLTETHADISGLLGIGLDAVVIAAPDALHPDLAIKALEAGLHVLCEKPLSLTLAGCDRIKAARDRAGRVLQVAYMKRHDPAF